MTCAAVIGFGRVGPLALDFADRSLDVFGIERVPFEVSGAQELRERAALQCLGRPDE